MNPFRFTLAMLSICLLAVAGICGQTQKSVSVRADDPGSPLRRTAEPDAPATSSSAAGAPHAVVPRLMKFSGTLHDAAGKPLPGTVDVTFSLYTTEAGGDALWFEMQSVQADELGRYTALLGAMHADGLPTELFTSGEVRWLGIQVGSEAEQQPRVLLVSVPYALKAGDAETLGGKPASAYMLTNVQEGATSTTTSAATSTGTTQTNASGKNKKSSGASNTPQAPCTSVTSDGTVAVNTIPLFSTACNIQGSNIHQYNGNVGVGIIYPSVGFYVSNPAKHDGDARFDMVLEDTTSATAGTGGGMDFTGYISGTTTKAGLASIRGVKENATQGNSASALIFDTRVNGGTQTERMRISSAGNVGIGTSAPAAKLDVNGTVNGTSATGNGVIGTTNGAGAGVRGVGNDVSSVGVMGQVTDPNGTAGVFSSAGGTILLGENGNIGVFNVDGSGRIAGSGAVLTGGFTAARLIVQGNAQNILAGDAGCNAGYAGFGFGSSALSGCTDYSMVGNGTDTILNRPTGGGLYFREANVGQMAIASGGNVGIGTTTPGEKLDVRGNVKLGGSGQWFAAGGDENLRIVRGQVNTDGSILLGSGFSVTRNSAGSYTITFTTPFSGPVVPVVSTNDGGFATIGGTGTSSEFFVFTENGVDGTHTDEVFFFIAVGPR